MQAGVLTESDYAVLFDHLSKFPDLKCPLCACTDWNVAEELEHGIWQNGKDKRTTGVLAVTLVCQRCSFIARLAWNGIKQAVHHQ